ncbi:MAG: glycoside hydrolase family 16 protein [Pyrinomonadaceae bacterium]
MSKRKGRRFPFSRNLPRRSALASALPVVVFIFLLVSYSCLGSPAPASNPAVWSLTWSDEFDGPNGSPVNSAKWSFDIGGNGWGNNELQSYTDRTANAALQDGALVIRALKETYTGLDNRTRDYTSARLLTRNKFKQTYGRFEARIKVPFGQGIWPAFWMLGDDLATAGWPNCGEIDIMEHIGREPSNVYGTLHGPGYSGGEGISASYSLPPPKKFSDDYHTYAVEWEPNVLRFYVDGLLYKTRTPADLPAGKAWVFNHPFFLIINVAVGGFWPGYPDATTVFPQQMLVDYVRVYQRASPSNVPLLFTDEGANRALALDSVTFMRDPFSVKNSSNFSADQTTRLMLLSANLDLQPGDGPSIVTVQADNGNGPPYLLTVEWIGRLPNFDWITVVIAKLPVELANANQALISITAHNQSSNTVLVSLSP